MQVTNIGRLKGGRNSAVLWGVLAAVVAAILLIVFVAAYRSSVDDDAATPVTVYVAKRLIPAGTPGAEIASKGLYEPTQVDSDRVKVGAILDPALMSGRTLQSDVFPGAQISDADFSQASAAASSGGGAVSGSITGAKRAVTVTVDPINGSLALLSAGDHVDIYQQVDASGGKVIKLLRADVPVLQNDGSGNVVLQVSALDAPDVLFASKNTELMFSIRPATGAKPTVPRTASNQTMLQYDRTH